MIGLHRPGTSLLHRLPAGAKLAGLALLGTLLMLVEAPLVLALALAVSVALYPVAGFEIGEAWRQVRPLLWIFALLALVQALVVSPVSAFVLVARFASLVLLAALVTATTPVAAMTEAIRRALAPLRPLGVSPVKIAFALTLAVRFVPVVAQTAASIREAQGARGLGSNPLALAVPLVIRTLAAAQAVAEAIEARGGLPEDAPPRREAAN